MAGDLSDRYRAALLIPSAAAELPQPDVGQPPRGRCGGAIRDVPLGRFAEPGRLHELRGDQAVPKPLTVALVRYSSTRAARMAPERCQNHAI